MKKDLIVKPNQQLMTQTLKEVQTQDNVQREVINVYAEPVKAPKKRDHLAEMRRGVIYFGISLIMMAVFVFTVLRPFEDDMVNKAHKEYSKLLKDSKALAKDYNTAMDLLRKSYRNNE